MRYLGRFLENPAGAPEQVVAWNAREIGVAASTDLAGYGEGEWRWAHQAEIRRAYGYRPFSAPGVELELVAWLRARASALAALGVYAQVPSERELAEQAIAAGGESVLAAALANALYGAAIGCGMLAEGHTLQQDTNRAERLALARAQVLRASGAEGPGFVGAMHWQAAHIAGPLRALKDREQAPLGQALAAASWALVLILQAICLAEPAGSRAIEVTDALAEARAELTAAERHLRRLDEQTADLADELEGLIAAAEDAMRAQGNGHTD